MVAPPFAPAVNTTLSRVLPLVMETRVGAEGTETPQTGAEGGAVEGATVPPN